ncbi:GDSL esterase/lipase At4g10955-like [Papaver somniferum]|uniref:GDSL esterase/lipase At4g10955-like n=1 Tax=Papaver somniferum TaxID=3469 RepID=UPI000E701F47|nr:GDSL esterase/lipase At4g10955-like [Papaver somniferum]
MSSIFLHGFLVFPAEEIYSDDRMSIHNCRISLIISLGITGVIPKYVIAFRGTTIKKHYVSQDLWLDLNIIKHVLHQSSRFGIAMQAVQRMASVAGASNVWLAGHFLGSSIAMLVGKNMAKMGNYLDTYLFNSPFIAAPTEKIQQEKVKHGVRFASSLVKVGITVAMKGTKENRNPDNLFTALAAWVPKLFVNPADLIFATICSEYIGYFEHRDRMEYLVVSGIERLATQTSVTGLLKSAIGMTGLLKS